MSMPQNFFPVTGNFPGKWLPAVAGIKEEFTRTAFRRKLAGARLETSTSTKEVQLPRTRLIYKKKTELNQQKNNDKVSQSGMKN